MNYQFLFWFLALIALPAMVFYTKPVYDRIRKLFTMPKQDGAIECINVEPFPVMTIVNGHKYWKLNGKLHREDGPAIEWSNGDKSWYKEGKRHREDGPAIEWSGGGKSWYKEGVEVLPFPVMTVENSTKYWKLNGKLHREDGPAVEWSNGSKEWYKEDKLHRVDGPAVEWSNGAKSWYKEGKRHREDGPAYECANGDKRWYKEDIKVEPFPVMTIENGDKYWRLNGKLHREDGPAVEYATGSKQWCKEGKLHRLDGPAYELANGDKRWYKEGQLHREDGPAIEYANGDKCWYKEGIACSEMLVESLKAVHKFKIGDKFIVTENGKKLALDGIHWVKGTMDRCCNEVMTVRNLTTREHKPAYNVKENNFYWLEEWLSPAISEKVFNIGDKVKIGPIPAEKRDNGIEWVSEMDKYVGKTVIISEQLVVNHPSRKIYGYKFSGNTWSWSPKWFEKIVETNPTKELETVKKEALKEEPIKVGDKKEPTKELETVKKEALKEEPIKVGDKVKVLNNRAGAYTLDGRSKLTVGDIIEVASIEGSNISYKLHNGNINCLYAQDVVLATPEEVKAIGAGYANLNEIQFVHGKTIVFQQGKEGPDSAITKVEAKVIKVGDKVKVLANNTGAVAPDGINLLEVGAIVEVVSADIEYISYKLHSGNTNCLYLQDVVLATPEEVKTKVETKPLFQKLQWVTVIPCPPTNKEVYPHWAESMNRYCNVIAQIAKVGKHENDYVYELVGNDYSFREDWLMKNV